MAKQQRPAEAPKPPAGGPFPDVSHERRDIDAAAVFWSGVGFAILVLSSTALAYGLSAELFRGPPPARPMRLPPAVADSRERPPSPRLEAIEDLRQGRRARLHPPRAASHLVPQEQELEKGGDGAIPIKEAMRNLKLEVRKDPTPAPLTFTTRLPSKGSAGRTQTGGDR